VSSKGLLLFVSALLLASGCKKQHHQLSIALISLGPVPTRDMTEARQAIEDQFDAHVYVVSKPVTLPDSAYYAPRKRYKAEKLISFLDDGLSIHSDRIIGITTSDISTAYRGRSDWGVIGSSEGRAAVVSTYRLGGKDVPQNLKDSRLRKNVLHELGHTFGLDHCPNTKCLMQDGQGGILTTDRADEAFCVECAKKLGHVLKVAHG